MRTYYTDENGNRHDVIPRMYKGITPFTKTYALQNGWSEHQEPDPPPPPATVLRYSKYRIQLACQKRGLWEKVKAAIAAAGMQDSWSNIIDITSDNPELVAALPAIRETFGADVVDAVLEEAVTE